MKAIQERPTIIGIIRRTERPKRQRNRELVKTDNGRKEEICKSVSRQDESFPVSSG